MQNEVAKFLEGSTKYVPAQGLNSTHFVSLLVECANIASVTRTSHSKHQRLVLPQTRKFCDCTQHKWTYIGEVLDLYSGNRYGSVKTAGLLVSYSICLYGYILILLCVCAVHHSDIPLYRSKTSPIYVHLVLCTITNFLV